MTDRFKILILNGPNLNLLGQREPHIYGKQRLDEIIDSLQPYASENRISLRHVQSNREYELIEALHDSISNTDFIIINPAAYTHSSIALRDALLASTCPFIEVHLSNIHGREAFRQHSYFSDKAVGVICGLGAQGYLFALYAAHNWLKSHN